MVLLRRLLPCVWVGPELLGCTTVTQVKGIAGDVPKRVGGFQDLGAGAGVEVGLQGGEDGDYSVDVVDANAHLEEEEEGL